MTTICSRRPTLTSTKVITSYSVFTTSRNVVSTSPARTSFIPYTTTTCTVKPASRVCSTSRTTRSSLVPYTTSMCTVRPTSRVCSTSRTSRTSHVPYTTTICTVRLSSRVCSSSRTSRTTRSSIVPYTTTICTVRPSSRVCSSSRATRSTLVPFTTTICTVRPTSRVCSTSRATRTSLVPSTATVCTVSSSSRVCSTISTSRPTTIPPRKYTTPVRYPTSRPVYSTSRATLYSTSCSVSTRLGVAPPLTSFVTTTTTEISDVAVPTTTTETSGVTFSTTTTETSVPDTSVPDPTDTPEPNVGSNSTPESRQLPIGKIVGGVFGGIAVAFLLGFLVYHLCFKKAKVHDRRLGNLERERSQLMSAMDGQLSPSEGSSGAFNSQMQESAARFANMDGLQDVQQHHPTSQETYNMTPLQPRRPYHPQQDGMIVVAMVAPLSPPSIEQEHYDQSQRSTGLYLGRPEVQDSRL